MSENLWINEGESKPQDDMMSSFLNYLDADDNNPNSGGNNDTISFEAALNSTELFGGSKQSQPPPQMNNLQQQFMQQRQQQMHNQQQFDNNHFATNQISQFQQQQMRNLTDNNDSLKEKNVQSPSQQGFAPNMFSPQMNQKQVGTQQHSNVNQFNPNIPRDRAAMLAILQQRANTPQQRFEQQLIQQKLIQHQQQIQQQMSPGTSAPPQGNNMNQQQVLLQMQQQQTMRLQQQQQQQQKSQQGSVPPTPQINTAMNSPQVQFNQPNQSQLRTVQQQSNHPTANGAQPGSLEHNRKIQQQLSAAHIELFMRALSDFMKSKGINLSIPVIADKRIHPFYFYAIVTRLGGSMNVNSMNQWNVVAQKLNLPVDMNPNIAGELAKAYAELLLPFEQYTSTPEGQQDLAGRRMVLQKQQEALLRQQNTQTPQQVIPQQQRKSSPAINQSQPPTPFNPSTRMSQSSMGASPSQQQVSIPPQSLLNSRKTSLQNSPMVDSTNSPNQVINLQQNQTKFVQQMRFQEHQSPVPTEPVEVKLGANIIRNYIPDQRLVHDLHLGYDIKALSAQGQALEESKPIFLFAPELGTINIHALTMSFDSGITSEVTTALNTALVTSADSNLQIPLLECGDFLEKLSALGLRTLDMLLTGKDNRINVEEEFDLENLNTAMDNGNIEQIFNKYVKNPEEYEEVEVTVDSFSGVAEKSDDIDTVEVVQSSQEEPEIPPILPQVIRQYHISSYLTMLQEIKHESEDVFSKIHTRTAEDPQVQLVEQLTTISMILRNITFTDNNITALVNNATFVEFLFKIIHSVATQPEKFIFTRRKLGLLKDSLMIFLNIAEGLYLRNHNDALAVIALVLTFGPDQVVVGGGISEYIPTIHKYQAHGVDVLAKLLVRDPPNRTFLKEVLTGIYDSTDVEMDEHLHMKELFLSGLNCELVHRLFEFLISVLPLNKMNPINLIQERDALVLQSLMALILLVDFLPLDQMQENITLRWLSLSENIGNGLIKLGLSLAALSVNHQNNVALYEIYSLISSRIFQLMNLLTSKTLEFMELHHEMKESLLDIKLFLPSDSILGVMLTDLNPEVLNEILSVNTNIRKINSMILGEKEG